MKYKKFFKELGMSINSLTHLGMAAANGLLFFVVSIVYYKLDFNKLAGILLLISFLNILIFTINYTESFYKIK